MKNKLTMGLLAFTFVVLALQFVSAIIPDGTELIISADNGIYARDYQYVSSYYGPQYRVYVDEDYDLNVAEYRYGPPSNYYGAYYSDYNPSLYGAYNAYNNQNYYNTYNYPRSGYYYFDKNDVKRYLVRQKVSSFIDNSAYSRYDLNYGKNSEVFCDTLDCQDKNPNPTNFRYKHTYDPRIEGTGSYQNYYYQPLKGPNTGAYNWRY